MVPASLERTWRLVTHPAALAEWFPGSRLDVRVGGAATFACGPGEVFHGVVECVEPPHRLVWRWSHVAGRSVDEGPTTRVHLLLAAVADGTRVQLVESGFGALADPQRRAILGALGGGEGVSASGLARRLPLTRQGVAKHLAVLEGAALVVRRRRGREVVYVPNGNPLRRGTAWMDALAAEWDARLAALARLAVERPDL